MTSASQASRRIASGGSDQGVPQLGAVVAGKGVLLTGLGVDDRVGAGEWHQGCFEEGAVLRGAAAADPDPTGPVVADREVAVEVSGSFLPLQRRFELSVDGVGVDDLDQVPAGPGELRGVQVRRLTEQHSLAAAADPVTRRQVIDGPDDDVGLHRRHGPGHQCVASARQRTAQGMRLLDPLLALAVA